MLGLGYVVTQVEPDYSDAVCRLTRSLRLKHHFRNEEQGNTDRPLPPFKPKSTWQPPKASKEIEDYLESLPEKIHNMETRTFRQNLRKAEVIAGKELQKDDTLVIKRADKGSCIVVKDTKRHIEDSLQHLEDTNIYQQIMEDPTISLTKGINELVQHLNRKGYIDSHMKNFLLFKHPENTRTQQLYFLKKLHKGARVV